MSYILWLVDMRIGFEVPVTTAEDPWDLLALIEMEQVPPYNDNGWTKNFQKGGSLEWYILPDSPASHIIMT